ncbi:MAG: dihydropteroate synthase [Synergistaceae bacterium]|nr:dihydropteroate synthase [Synergistaceae bacterium]
MIYPLNVKNYSELLYICKKIQTDPRAFGYLEPKSNILHFYSEHVDYRAAAFLKQELLARGGDTIVTKHVIDGKTDYSDVLLMGTPSQLKSLIEKLKSMDCWGLKNFREEFSKAFANIFIKEWRIKSHTGREIILSDNTKLMAVMNLTPDSFHAESRVKEEEILTRAEKFLSQGAYILDLGAESTRPGFEPVELDEEIKRLLPALKTLRKKFPDALISVDTYKSQAAEIALNEGADIINDISGFEDNKMPEIISRFNAPYVLSHIKPDKPSENILSDIILYFQEKLKILNEAGVKRSQLILDPGLGFGKNSEENFAIIKNLESLKIFGLPILIGHSRKRFTGKNLFATVALSGMLYGRANILRVHDVEENLTALSMARSLE